MALWVLCFDSFLRDTLHLEGKVFLDASTMVIHRIPVVTLENKTFKNSILFLYILNFFSYCFVQMEPRTLELENSKVVFFALSLSPQLPIV